MPGDIRSLNSLLATSRKGWIYDVLYAEAKSAMTLKLSRYITKSAFLYYIFYNTLHCWSLGTPSLIVISLEIQSCKRFRPQSTTSRVHHGFIPIDTSKNFRVFEGL